MTIKKGKEIERKFIILENGLDHTIPKFRELFPNVVGNLRERIIQEGIKIYQGYIQDLKLGVVVAEGLKLKYDFDPVEARFRKKWNRNTGKIEYTFCLKGVGYLERDEAEKKIRENEYIRNYILTRGHRISKTRLVVPYEGHNLELNSFDNLDLILAEVEFESKEAAAEFPDIGKEITNDIKYFGRTLAGIVSRTKK